MDRLEAHVRDLESRKRAPLYQKKQVRRRPAATGSRGIVLGCLRRSKTARGVARLRKRMRFCHGVKGAGLEGGDTSSRGACLRSCFSPACAQQEAELQAALDKAIEAEARASEAEVRMKEAKVRR